MTERFLRARTRLSKQEQTFFTDHEKKRRLNMVPDEESVKIPIIGEWDVSQQEREPRSLIQTQSSPIRQPAISRKTKLGTKKPGVPFAVDIPFSLDQKPPAKPANDSPNRITSPPKSRLDTIRLRTAGSAAQQRVIFPPGTTTTNLDDIIAAKHRSPTRALPPLKAPEPDDEEVAPNFLPLEVFDDSSYDEYSYEYLMEHPLAWSKYQDKGEVVWRKCTVLGYEDETALFLIEWCDDKKQKKVARFNLRFDIETEARFEERIEAAKRAAFRYEMQFRFDSRVQAMPLDDLPDLSPTNLHKTVAMMRMKLTPEAEEKVHALIAETCHNFKLMNNRFQFEYDLQHNLLIPDRNEFLKLLPKPKPAPPCGLAVPGPPDFAQNLRTLASIHLNASKAILEALNGIWSIFVDNGSLVFLSGQFPDLIALDEYLKRQEALLEKTAAKFKQDIHAGYQNGINATLYGVELTADPDHRVKFRKTMILATRMIHTFLFQSIEKTLSEFSSLFKKPVEKPQFTIDLHLRNSKLELEPSIECFKNSMLNLLQQLDDTVTGLSSLSLPLHDVNLSVVSFADCLTMVNEERKRLSVAIDKVIESSLGPFIGQYSKLEEFFALDPVQFAKTFDPNGKKSLDEYRQELAKFLNVIEILENEINDTYVFSIFFLNCQSFKKDAISHIKNVITAVLTQMKDFAVMSLNELESEFNSIVQRMKVSPNTPEELAELRTFISNTVKSAKTRQENIQKACERFAFLDEYRFDVADDDFQHKYKIMQIPAKLTLAVEETERKIQVEKSVMIRELRQKQRQLETDSLAVTDLLPAFILKYQDLDMTVDAYDDLCSLDKKLSALRKRQEQFSTHERLFDFEPSPCSVLQKLIEEFQPIKALWTLADQWLLNKSMWLDSQFTNTKPDQINLFIIQATKQINKLKKDLESHPNLVEKVLKPLGEQIDKFKSQIPLVSKLRHPGIKTKHWEQISEVVEFKVTPIDHTLQDFLDYNLNRWSEPITEIANVAANEYNIETSLDQMDNELQTQQFITAEYKDSKRYILCQVDDIISLIDDQLVTTQTLLTSPFIAPVKKRAVERLAFLRLCHDILDQWVECQRGWLYLQPIFTGTSIQQKLHREARDWNTVDRTWDAIMSLTHKHPDFTNVMHRNNLLQDLKDSNALLESITTGLNAYLESKRHGFPRFFFLSNDELIAILSHTKDFTQIQKSMNKLFEYVQTITVDEKLLITAMNDDGLESVPLTNPVNGDTPEIEDWLNAFEGEMQGTLKKSIKDALEASATMNRDEWIGKYPAQAILISNQIIWTREVTRALETRTLRQIKLLQKKYVDQLEQLTAIVRQNLTPPLRQVIQCVLINEVHNRDIIQNIIRQEEIDVESFKWQVQLRYYWEDETVIVKSINNVYEYSYEYAGNSARLVITPLTDRCYQTLLSSFKQNMSGAPSGPAGTGKTETVRDCAKALGRSCVVYNCSEEVTPEQMSQFFAGLSSSGSWSCFDEFNRINIEVLSVIAQQVRTIQNAIAAGVDTFVLDQRTLKLNANAAICITMNPGYAGRTELPDNLKALFRPCAMMVPDFAFIAEILLFSGGFKDASVLSVKLVALFDLCRTQLSKSHHYDWGMRAMKSILTTASKAKREDLERPEDIVLVESIENCTKPRLISADLLLFDNICHDVFPEVFTEKQIPEDLKDYLSQAFPQLNAIPLPVFMSKASELYDTSMVRHGIMLVGGPMGGKTTCWKALQIARKMYAENGKGWGIHVDALNPKAISIPELYGLFDPVSSGWSDGVLSSKIRDCSMSDPTEYKWIVVDGPVDSLWIETMNSLLDDNKVLCLSNNERISLGSHVKMVFEVDDLSQASPATVSRCGMVYFDPSVLEWEAIADSYVQTSNHEIQVIVRQYMNEYIPKLIEFIKTSQNVAIGSNPLFLFKNFIRLIKCFMDLLRKPEYETVEEGEDAKEIDSLNHDLYFSPMRNHEGQKIGYFTDDYSNLALRTFAFCSIWAFGGVLNEEGRIQFDKFIRGLFPFLPNIPNRTVFDFFLNMATLQFDEWTDGKTGFSLTETKPIEQQLVPTNNSAAMIYLSRLLVHHDTHVLLHGPESSKTLAVKTLMENVLEKMFDCRYLPLANGSTSANVLKVLRSFMQRSHGAYGPLDNQKLVIFLDNMGAVKPEQYGAQPPLELIRQFFDYGGWYDTSKVEFQKIVGTTMIGSMGCAGGGLYSIPERVLRHFFFIHCPKYDANAMTLISTNLLQHHLHEYAAPVKELAGTIARASTSIFEQCTSKLLPVPGKSHYLFSLRNIVRVLKGMFMCPATEVSTQQQLVTLWYHEMMREFHDRFNSKEDREWFVSILNNALDTTFKIENKSSCEQAVFTEFFEGTSTYHQIKLSTDEVLGICRDVLEEHNRDAAKSLDIVLFSEAISHISSIARVLSMPRGHAMLVGVKSSGRKSLASLALHMASMEPFEIKITRTYGLSEWRDDMKTLMKQCGVSDMSTGFVLSDVQIIGSFQLEDISNLLINGEIPNLYERDEMEQIKADIVQAELLVDEDPWKLFTARAKKNLHLILVFSPFGSIFRESMLSYPALRTETTIDWYMPWSSDALESVAAASLSKLELGSPELVNSIVRVCVKVHKSVEDASVSFLKEHKRFTACTPSRYFELLATFAKRLKESQKTNTETIKNYVTGIDKITTTRQQIEGLSQQLDRDIPMLEQKRADVAKMLVDLQAKQREVEETKAEVKQQSELAEKEAAAAAETNKIAQKQLAAAQPILEAAQEAVASMDKDSLVNIKTLKKIHPALRETFEAICIIFGRSPRRVDGDIPGTKKDDYWPETLSLLNDFQFIKKVKMFEVEKLSKETINKLKKYVGANKSERDKKLSEVQGGYQAVGNLYQWVCASYDYWFVYQEVLPKKIEAEQAEAKLKESVHILAERRKHLRSVEAELTRLQEMVDAEKKNEQSLADSVANTQLRLRRAEQILQGLSGETKRWGECANTLQDSAKFIVGDTLLVAASLTHLGAFGPTYRAMLIKKWKEFLDEVNIQFNREFTIAASLGNDPTIREWIVKGLPNDVNSIENAIIIENSAQAFPLLIDPQLSGTKWLRAIKGDKLSILRFDQSDFLAKLKGCVTYGIPVLVENVGLKLDPLIEPILSRELIVVDGQRKVPLGGEYVSYSDGFQLYLSTKYPNPHYSPEICSQVTLINFTTTPTGLKDLLMNNLIEVEQAELDKMRIAIMEANAENMKKLKDVEKEILEIVSNAGSDILDDDKAIQTLQKAQRTSADIEKQMAKSATTEKLISDFREKYSSVAERAALLYFCAADFAVVDPMYQFSLKWFVTLFKQAISKANHDVQETELIKELDRSVAESFFQSVSFSLFSKHKLLFSTLMTTRILLANKDISGTELAFLLQPEPSNRSKELKYIPDDVWPLLVSLESVSPVFHGLIDSFKANEKGWKAYMDSTEPEKAKIPYDKELTPFQRLLILRVCHLHRVREGLRIFVSETLGEKFVTPPPLNLLNVFKDSSPLAPLIFIITPGIDPVDEVTGVVSAMDMEKYLRCYSLGRGRGQGAEELILDSADKGFLVLLQNCHLSLSWMPRLEFLIDHLDPAKVHERFRLCLVTMSDDRFPIGILYQGTKLIYEIPKGIRENILRIYNGFSQDEYNQDWSSLEKQLTFHLSFFHAVVLERLQFGSIGWNIPYEFNPSDFAISKKHLKTFLTDASDVPFEALSYVIGELNYGGRVTDPLDRRLLLSLLQRFFSEEINSPDFSFGERYPSPDFGSDMSSVISVVSGWPIVTEGEDVGLAMNASTITARNDAMRIFNSLIEIQPTLVAAGGEISEEQFALNFVLELMQKIPEEFDVYSFTQNFDLSDTINTVLHHELVLYNKLLLVIKASLATLSRGLKGLIVIDEKLDLLNRRLLANKVPEAWLVHSFPSILSLRSYIEDLQMRTSFMRNWVVSKKRPIVYRLGAFFHPEEFLTAVLQVYARKKKIPFDTLKWKNRFLKESPTQASEDGIFVENLYMEGAKFDIEKVTLAECGQRELISVLPITELIPCERGPQKRKKTPEFACPIYRMQNRGTGALDLPNHIMDLIIEAEDPDHWIERSVAVFVTAQI